MTLEKSEILRFQFLEKLSQKTKDENLASYFRWVIKRDFDEVKGSDIWNKKKYCQVCLYSFEEKSNYKLVSKIVKGPSNSKKRQFVDYFLT